jgi:CRISPR-associated protein Cmr3
MKIYSFSPIDTWFFRDGRPYNQGEMNQAEISSLFPPPATGMVGGMRSALAMNQGWIGTGDWPNNIKKVLGDQTDLAKLRFYGPNIMLNDTPLYPAPAILLGRPSASGWGNISRLRPGKSLDCDLGNVHLPVAEQQEEGLKELADSWLTLSGLQQVLDGGLPDLEKVIPSSLLWSLENRVGIELTPDTGIVKDGALYATGHIRLRTNVTLALAVQGLPNEWEPASPAGFGGEGRMTWIEPFTGSLPSPIVKLTPSRDGKLRYIVVLATPADLPIWPGPGECLPGLPGHVALACMGRALRVGGWDFRERKPYPLKPLLPAGSVWFMEAEAGVAEQVEALHGTHIGERTEWGFGQFFIGTWKEDN